MSDFYSAQILISGQKYLFYFYAPNKDANYKLGVADGRESIHDLNITLNQFLLNNQLPANARPKEIRSLFQESATKFQFKMNDEKTQVSINQDVFVLEQSTDTNALPEMMFHMMTACNTYAQKCQFLQTDLARTELEMESLRNNHSAAGQSNNSHLLTGPDANNAQKEAKMRAKRERNEQRSTLNPRFLKRKVAKGAYDEDDNESD